MEGTGTITATVNGRVQTWVPGIIGTYDWVRESRAATAARAALRDAGIGTGIARADAAAGFDCMPAPSGISEPVHDGCTGCGGAMGDAPVTPFEVRRVMRNYRRLHRLHRRRQSVLLAARVSRSNDVAASRAASVPAYISPLVRLAHDVAEGRFVRSSVTVSERVYFIPTDDAGYFSRRRPTHRNDYGRVTLESPGYMVQLERLHREYRDEHRLHESVMRDEPHNSGRGAIAHRAPDAVNGTEVRGAERWAATRPSECRGKDGKLIDRTCYRVLPNGRRVPLVSTATGNRRKAATVSRRAAATVPTLTAASLPRVEVD